MAHTFKPAQDYCKRCGELFVYFQMDARRLYCSPCQVLERQDAILFQRLQRRKAAVASGRRRPFARFSAPLVEERAS